MVSVEAIEAFLGAEPEETILILNAGEDGAIGKAVLYLVVPEIVALCIKFMHKSRE